ncbi:MAG: hypothetical protein ACKPFA_20515, partial [Dolichospermum sp.]
DIGQKIIDRCDRFLNRLPLLNQYLQRWQGFNEMSVDSVPIVYALPALRESENNQSLTENQGNKLVPNTEKTIQLKTESSTPLTLNAVEKKEHIIKSILVKSSTKNEISPEIEMPLSIHSTPVTPGEKSENNEIFTVNQTNNLVSNTEKKIQLKTESLTPLTQINYTENRESNTANPIVIQASTGNEISSAIEMPLVTNSESLEVNLQQPLAIATSSTMINLFFDTTFEIKPNKNVQNYTRPIYNLAQINMNLKRPPRCRLVWGTISGKDSVLLPDGFLISVTKTLTHFLEDGTPVRATLDCTFKEWQEPGIKPD